MLFRSRCPCENNAKKIGPFTAPGRRLARCFPVHGVFIVLRIGIQIVHICKRGLEFNRNNQHCPVRFQASRLRAAWCSGCHASADNPDQATFQPFRLCHLALALRMCRLQRWAITGEFGLGCIGLLVMFTGFGQLVIFYSQQKKNEEK